VRNFRRNLESRRDKMRNSQQVVEGVVRDGKRRIRTRKGERGPKKTRPQGRKNGSTSGSKKRKRGRDFLGIIKKKKSWRGRIGGGFLRERRGKGRRPCAKKKRGGRCDSLNRILPGGARKKKIQTSPGGRREPIKGNIEKKEKTTTSGQRGNRRPKARLRKVSLRALLSGEQGSGYEKRSDVGREVTLRGKPGL